MSTSAPAPSARPLRLWHLLTGLLAGTAVGLFFGDGARVLEPVADAFVKLMQMAVLPYITVSIAGSIGALDVSELRRLGLRVALVLLALWTLALGFAFLMPLAFPPSQNASFFSTTLLEPPQSFNLVDLYIPANPFHALANSIVPAVVLFSMMVGVALNGLPRKHVLLEILQIAGDTLARTMRFLVHLTPYGIFAIAATTAGTIRVEQAARLEVYLVSYAGIALLFALWVLPGLVSALTPIPARAIFKATREALLTATIVGDQFIVLPVLIASCKDLVARHGGGDEHAAAMPDVIVPASYNFPHSGKLLSISFILFAGWFSDAAIDPTDYPRLGLTGLFTLFGSVTTAIPFLLDLFRVPADTFQLFVASGVINSRFGTLVAAMHTVAMALLGTCAATGALRWQPLALARYAVTTVILTLVIVGGTRLLATRGLVRPFTGGDILAAMTVEPRAGAIVLDHAAPPPAAPEADGRLRAIAARRTLKVGFLPDALPYAFFNGRHELVGLDVALMHRLAIELGARLEFVPVERETLDRAEGVRAGLLDGSFDIVIGGLAVTPARAEAMQLSESYLDETMGFVVPDGERRHFESWDAIRARGALAIAVPDVPYYIDRLHALLPQAQLRPVASFDAMFQAPALAAAFALPAERGSAWTLRYPQYSVVVPAPKPLTVPLAFAMPRGERDLATFVDTWIDLKRRDGTIDELYHFWILGRDSRAAGPRWSIIRDVLHWVPARPIAAAQPPAPAF